MESYFVTTGSSPVGDTQRPAEPATELYARFQGIAKLAGMEAIAERWGILAIFPDRSRDGQTHGGHGGWGIVENATAFLFRAVAMASVFAMVFQFHANIMLETADGGY